MLNQVVQDHVKSSFDYQDWIVKYFWATYFNVWSSLWQKIKSKYLSWICYPEVVQTGYAVETPASIFYLVLCVLVHRAGLY